MTTTDLAPKTKNWIAYVLLGVVFVALAIVALFVFRSAKASATANAKADQLTSAIQAAGYHAPEKDQIVRTLGDDGGAVCDNPNNAFRHAVLNDMLANGAAGPGMRPVIADSLAVKGQVLIMSIYCPDKLPDFAKYAETLKTANVVKR